MQGHCLISQWSYKQLTHPHMYTFCQTGRRQRSLVIRCSVHSGIWCDCTGIYEANRYYDYYLDCFLQLDEVTTKQKSDIVKGVCMSRATSVWFFIHTCWLRQSMIKMQNHSKNAKSFKLLRMEMIVRACVRACVSVSPSAPWQISVLVAFSTMNFGLEHNSWEKKRVQIYSDCNILSYYHFLFSLISTVLFYLT